MCVSRGGELVVVFSNLEFIGKNGGGGGGGGGREEGADEEARVAK